MLFLRGRALVTSTSRIGAVVLVGIGTSVHTVSCRRQQKALHKLCSCFVRAWKGRRMWSVECMLEEGFPESVSIKEYNHYAYMDQSYL